MARKKSAKPPKATLAKILSTVERGFADLTIEGIAARAGVAKQTIYRWWDSKSDILFDALITDAEEHFTPPDHGDLASDLRDHLGQLAAFLACTDSGAVFRFSWV